MGSGRGFFDVPQINTQAAVAGDDMPVFANDYEQGAGDYRRALIEECAAGATVERLPSLQDIVCNATHQRCRKEGLCPDACPADSVADIETPIPITAAPASLAEEVAGELLEQHENWREWLRAVSYQSPGDRPPFAAAYTDAGGVRTYVLRSAECEACAGTGYWGDNRGSDRCTDCSGRGTTTDVDAISRRYGGADGRFEVML